MSAYIKITPPATPAYVPSTQSVASVLVMRQDASGPPKAPRVGTLGLQIWLFDTKGRVIGFDKSAIPPMTDEQSAAFTSMPANAGDDASTDLARRTLPYLLAAYGLTGTIGT
jgi:hypothetical protein